MKKSELRKLIREEISKVDPDTDMGFQINMDVLRSLIAIRDKYKDHGYTLNSIAQIIDSKLKQLKREGKEWK